MRRSKAFIVGAVCFLLGGISLALAQTAMRPDQFVARSWTWTGLQLFDDNKFFLLGSSSGGTTLKAPASGGGTVTFPTGTGTLSFSGGGFDPTSPNSFTALQTFNNSDIALLGSSTGKTTFTSANSGGSNFTLTIPAASTTIPIATQTLTLSGPTAARTFTLPDATATLATLGQAQTWTAVQTVTNSDLALLGSSTGKTTFTSANAGASNFTLTVPAASTTIPVATQTLTYTGPTAARTITYPDSAFTAAGIDIAQTWTAAQTFGPVIGGTNSQSGTTYTLAATDCGKTVIFTNASAVTVTTLNSLVVGCSIAIQQSGAGQVTVANGSGATLNSFDSYTKTAGQWAIIGLFVDTNSGGSSAHYVLTGRGA